MRKVSIILLWWSRTPDLELMAQSCLNSIIKNTRYTNYEIIIIENKSIHPSKHLRELDAKLKENNDTSIRIYFQDENLGFIKGNNLGMKLAGDNDVLLINNDTLVPVGWLTPIVACAERHEDAGLIMPHQLHKGSKEFREFNSDIMRLMDYLTEKVESNKDRVMDKLMTDGDWLPLACTYIPRRAINAVGYLDEAFGLGGFDDTDYSWRCLDEGFNLYLVGNSYFFHYYGQSFHFHNGYAEVWIETGKYLINKYNALQTKEGAVYRLKDKTPSWYERNKHSIKPEDIGKFEAKYATE